MEKIINAANAELFAHTNASLITGEIRGIVVNFHGLNNTSFIRDNQEPSQFYARRGILFVFPYYDPWGWMNDECVDYTDQVLDALTETYGCAGVPVASTGGSMGGMACLLYTIFSAHHPVLCAADSPVCDFVFHYTERPDLPRTIYHALYRYDGTLEEGLRALSPLHLVDRMPRVPYYIVHGDADLSVNKQKHSDRLVAAMRERGLDVTYDEVPGMTHCKMDFEHAAKYYDFIAAHLLNGNG